MSIYSAAKIRSGLREFLLGRVAAAGLSFVTNILIVRQLAEDAYASYATLAGLQLILVLLLSFGIERVMARYAGEGAMRWSRRSLLQLVGGGVLLRASSLLLLMLATIPVAEWIAIRLNVPTWSELAPAFWVYTFFFGVFEAMQAVAQSFMCQKAIRMSLTVQWGLRVLAVCVYVAYQIPLGLTDVMWIFASTSIAPVLILIPPIFHVVAGRPESADPADSSMSRRQVLSLGSHNYLEKLANLPSSGAFFRLLAANALPTVATASFGFYQTLWGVFHRHMPTTIAMGMLEATVAGRYADKRDFREVETVLSVMLKVNLLALVPLIAWLAVSGPQIVSLLTGGKYVGQAWALAVITTGLIPAGLWQLVIVHSNAMSRSEVLYRASLWASFAVVPVALGVFLFPDFGLFLLATAVPVIGFIQLTLAMLLLKASGRPFRLPIRGGALQLAGGILAGTSGALMSDLALIQHGLLSVIFSGACVLACFFLVAYVSKIFETDEYALLGRLHSRIAWSLSWMCRKG